MSIKLQDSAAVTEVKHSSPSFFRLRAQRWIFGQDKAELEMLIASLVGWTLCNDTSVHMVQFRLRAAAQ